MEREQTPPRRVGEASVGGERREQVLDVAEAGEEDEHGALAELVVDVAQQLLDQVEVDDRLVEPLQTLVHILREPLVPSFRVVRVEDRSIKLLGAGAAVGRRRSSLEPRRLRGGVLLAMVLLVLLEAARRVREEDVARQLERLFQVVLLDGEGASLGVEDLAVAKAL